MKVKDLFDLFDVIFARYQLATIAVTIFEGIDFHQEKGEIKVVTFQKRSYFKSQ